MLPPLDAELSEGHLRRLGSAIDCDSLEKLRDALLARVEVLYFYTHGRIKPLPGTTSKRHGWNWGGILLSRIVAWRRAFRKGNGKEKNGVTSQLSTLNVEH